MDVVIPVRAGDANPELRTALRCLEANYPAHGDIWIVGHCPAWLINVNHIPGNQYPGINNRNVYANVLCAAEHPDIPGKFVVFNDDFMVTEPVDGFPVWHHGPLAEQCEPIRRKPKTWWHRSLLLTLETLQHAGYENPTSYEIHCPLPVSSKQVMADALREFAHVHRHGIPAQWRTVFGNLAGIGGERHGDCKARHKGGPVLKPFHSTSDGSFRWYKAFFDKNYPTPSRYEKGG